jgi:hypothetical protein
MASPFAVFRKYQAMLLVVFGVLIIVVFTIGDSVSRIASDGGGSVQDEVVVKWDGTELRQSRLQAIGVSRQIGHRALIELQNAAMQKGAFPRFQQQLAFMQRINPGGFLNRPRMIFTGGDLTPLGTVRSLVLAQRAAEIGMVVPDTQIHEYLRGVTDGKLTYEEMRSILVGGKKSRYPMSMKSIFDVLRHEMLADKMFEEFFRGTLAMPYAQQLDYFSRSNRQIEAEVIEIPVSQFVQQVADPSELQLQEYFDKYKFQTPLFDNIAGVIYESSDPGFKLPHRVSVEYVKAGVDEMITQVYDDVTDEEIAAYYEENKQRDEQMHAADALPLPEASSLEEGNSAVDGKKEPIDGDKSAVPETPTEKKREVPDTKEGDSSNQYHKLPLQFAAYAPEEPTEEKQSAPKAEGEVGAENEGETKEGVSEDASGDGAIATPNPAAAGGDGSGKKDPRIKEPRYKPLDEVRDYIRQKVAEQKANALIDAKFAAIRKRMNSYAAARQYASDEGIALVKRPDFGQLAEKQGLRSDSIDNRSAWYFQRETDIGKSFQRESPSQFSPYGSQQQYVQIIFQEGEQSWFNPIESTDDENARYLSWKTDEALAEIPKLESVARESVLRSWKEGSGRTVPSESARELALNRGKELAASLRRGAELDELARQAGGRKIVTEAFSWLTTGSAPMANPFSQPPLRLSEIDGIDQAGPDFMRAVFALDVGQVGVAMNHPKTHMYVIRVTFQNKSAEVLQSDFLARLEDRGMQQQVNSAAQLDHQLLSERWFEEVDRSLHLIWLNPAARFSR